MYPNVNYITSYDRHIDNNVLNLISLDMVLCHKLKFGNASQGILYIGTVSRDPSSSPCIAMHDFHINKSCFQLEVSYYYDVTKVNIPYLIELSWKTPIKVTPEGDFRKSPNLGKH